MLEALAVIAAVVVVFFLVNLLVRRVFSIPLLCHLGLHRWRKMLVGRGRDARYVVKCAGCDVFKDEA
jgi:hypothetical protein